MNLKLNVYYAVDGMRNAAFATESNYKNSNEIHK